MYLLLSPCTPSSVTLTLHHAALPAQAEPEAVAKLPACAGVDKSSAFVDVTLSLLPTKKSVKLGPMQVLLPLALKGGPPVHLTVRADVQVRARVGCWRVDGTANQATSWRRSSLACGQQLPLQLVLLQGHLHFSHAPHSTGPKDAPYSEPRPQGLLVSPPPRYHRCQTSRCPRSAWTLARC